MSCYLEDADAGTRVAVLLFKRTQLLYDIGNYAYIEGSVMDTDSNHRRHMVQDVAEDGNVDRVTRVLEVAVAKCREVLYPYTKHKIGRGVLDDRLREPGVYGIVMRVPRDFSGTTLSLLERLIHEYLVTTAVWDWLSITNPDKAAIWREKAEGALSELLQHLNARMGLRRRRLHPF